MSRELNIVLFCTVKDALLREAVSDVINGQETGYSAAVKYYDNMNAQVQIRRYTKRIEALCKELNISY